MVHMAHNGYNRWSDHSLSRLVFFHPDDGFLFKSRLLDIIIEFRSNQGCRFKIHSLVHRGHDPQRHELPDEIGRFDTHPLG